MTKGSKVNVISSRGDAVIGAVTLVFTVGTERMRGARTERKGSKCRQSGKGRGNSIRVNRLSLLNTVAYEIVLIKKTFNDCLSGEVSIGGQGVDMLLCPFAYLRCTRY